jgi:hypothetical protein
MKTGPSYLITNNLDALSSTKVDLNKIFDELCVPDNYDELAGKMEYFPDVDKTAFAKKLIAE